MWLKEQDIINIFEEVIEMEKNVYICKKCNKAFESREELRIHIFHEHLYPGAKSRPSSFTEEQTRQMMELEMVREE